MQAVIGCDKVNSVVERWLGQPAPGYSGRWAARGMSMFPQGHGLNYEFQQFVTKNKRAGVPLNDKQLYWLLIIPIPSIQKGLVNSQPKTYNAY